MKLTESTDWLPRGVNMVQDGYHSHLFDSGLGYSADWTLDFIYKNKQKSGW